MGKGRGSDDFNEVGPTHLKDTDVDWKSADHKRIVAACLVMGVYVLERDRQNKGDGEGDGLAKPWFSSFNFNTDRLIRNKDESISGAVYKFESRSDGLPPEAPEYVIAFRGTVLKEESCKEDLRLDFHILHQRFHKRKHTKRATAEVETVVFPNKDAPDQKLPNVWLVGHSLGSALAIQAGKKVAKKNANLSTFLFNPPYPSLVTGVIGHEKAEKWFEKKKRKFKTKLANCLKEPHQLKKDKEDFAKLSSWSPHLFVNQNDWICSGYIGYFNRRKRIKETHSDEGILDAMYSTRALFKGVVKKKIETVLLKKKKGNKDESDYEPFYLLPSATLFINGGLGGDKGRVKHGIKQWWSKDLPLEETSYCCDHCKLYGTSEEKPCNEEELEYQEKGVLEGEPQGAIESSADDIVDV